jgi:hypothetical protein
VDLKKVSHRFVNLTEIGHIAPLCKQCLHKVFSYIIRTDMNFEILLQLAAILFVFAAGPLVIILLASRSGNL